MPSAHSNDSIQQVWVCPVHGEVGTWFRHGDAPAMCGIEDGPDDAYCARECYIACKEVSRVL